MSHQPVIVVGDGNIAGNNLNNIGNRTQNIFNGRQKGKGTLLLNVPAQCLVLIVNGQRSRCSSQKQPWMRSSIQEHDTRPQSAMSIRAKLRKLW